MASFFPFLCQPTPAIFRQPFPRGQPVRPRDAETASERRNNAMINQGWQKLILLGLCGLLALICGVLTTVLVQTHREFSAFKAREAKLQDQLTEVQQQNQAREEYLNRLLSDPEFFERVVRQRLGYSKPDELVFRFEAEKNPPPNAPKR